MIYNFSDLHFFRSDLQILSCIKVTPFSIIFTHVDVPIIRVLLLKISFLFVPILGICKTRSHYPHKLSENSINIGQYSADRFQCVFLTDALSHWFWSKTGILGVASRDRKAHSPPPNIQKYDVIECVTYSQTLWHHIDIIPYSCSHQIFFLDMPMCNIGYRTAYNCTVSSPIWDRRVIPPPSKYKQCTIANSVQAWRKNRRYPNWAIY